MGAALAPIASESVIGQQHAAMTGRKSKGVINTCTKTQRTFERIQ